MPNKIRVLIVDDHQMIIDGIKALLLDVPDIAVIGQALHGRKALRQLIATHVDIVLMDINMPEMNGLDTTREILEKFPRVHVVMLTQNTHPMHIQQFIDLGAHGYLPKNTGREELLLAIRTVMNEGRYFSPDILQILIKNKHRAQAPVMLTPREQQVLEAIVDGKTTDDISAALQIGKQTVLTYRKNLLKKLKANNMAGLVRIALVEGMVERGQV